MHNGTTGNTLALFFFYTVERVIYMIPVILLRFLQTFSSSKLFFQFSSIDRGSLSTFHQFIYTFRSRWRLAADWCWREPHWHRLGHRRPSLTALDVPAPTPRPSRPWPELASFWWSLDVACRTLGRSYDGLATLPLTESVVLRGWPQGQ